MKVYAEASAVLAWLLDEPAARAVRHILRKAETVVTSELTLVECDRALERLEDRAGALRMGERLRRVAEHWELLRLDVNVVNRARQRFPGGPLGTVEALHLASLLVAREAMPELALLSLDEATRERGIRLGFVALPEED